MFYITAAHLAVGTQIRVGSSRWEITSVRRGWDGGKIVAEMVEVLPVPTGKPVTALDVYNPRAKLELA